MQIVRGQTRDSLKGRVLMVGRMYVVIPLAFHSQINFQLQPPTADYYSYHSGICSMRETELGKKNTYILLSNHFNNIRNLEIRDEQFFQAQ